MSLGCCSVTAPEGGDDREDGNISSMFAPLQLEAPFGVYKMAVTLRTNISVHTSLWLVTVISTTRNWQQPVQSWCPHTHSIPHTLLASSRPNPRRATKMGKRQQSKPEAGTFFDHKPYCKNKSLTVFINFFVQL